MEWTKKQIDQLIINQEQERYDLEYKGAGSLENTDVNKKEISKDVSAMANSAGGTIIYGISENTDKEGKHKQIIIEPLDQRIITREWLDQVISSNISPRIHGIKILSFVINNENEVVYVVEIPKSDTAHQAKDKKYYKRFNSTTDAMLDYEIRDVMGRNKNPKFELSFIIECVKTYSSGNLYSSNPPYHLISSDNQTREKIEYNLYVEAINKGFVYAKYVNAIFHIPNYLIDDEDENNVTIIDNIKYTTVKENNTICDYLGYRDARHEYGPSRYEPILPGLLVSWKISIKNINEISPNGNFNPEDKIIWTIYADNAPSISGEIFLNKININTRNEPLNH